MCLGYTEQEVSNNTSAQPGFIPERLYGFWDQGLPSWVSQGYEREAMEYDDIELLNRIELAIDRTNLIQRLRGKNMIKAKLLNDNLDTRRQIISIEQSAYTDSGYGEEAEGASFFGNQYRGSEVHTSINYFGLKQEQDIIFWGGLFRTLKPIFDVSNIFLQGEGEEYRDLPIYIFSKIARDPQKKRVLVKDGSPHRLLLSNIVLELAKSSENGILVEMQAQPDTQRMLREKVVSKYIPGYKVLLENKQFDEGKKGPQIMLLYFPRLSTIDLLFNMFT